MKASEIVPLEPILLLNKEYLIQLVWLDITSRIMPQA